MRRCKEATTEDSKSRHYIDILLSSCEYDTFVRLMKIMRPVALHRQALKAEAKGVVTSSSTSPSKLDYTSTSPSSYAKDYDSEKEVVSAPSDAKSASYEMDYRSDPKASTSNDEYSGYKNQQSSDDKY